jgi:nucleoside-diphosphate-sugar epimerase
VKVLITGNCGYIGSHLFRQLMFAPGIELTGCDLKANAPLDYRYAFRDGYWDVVIHLAASVSVMESFLKPFEYFDNNALGLAKFFETNYAKRFIFISTGGAMYGDCIGAQAQALAGFLRGEARGCGDCDEYDFRWTGHCPSGPDGGVWPAKNHC